MGPQKRYMAKPNAAVGATSGTSTSASSKSLNRPQGRFTRIIAMGKPNSTQITVAKLAISSEVIDDTHSQAHLLSAANSDARTVFVESWVNGLTEKYSITNGMV